MKTNLHPLKSHHFQCNVDLGKEFIELSDKIHSTWGELSDLIVISFDVPKSFLFGQESESDQDGLKHLVRMDNEEFFSPQHQRCERDTIRALSDVEEHEEKCKQAKEKNILGRLEVDDAYNDDEFQQIHDLHYLSNRDFSSDQQSDQAEKAGLESLSSQKIRIRGALIAPALSKSRHY